MVSKYPEIHQLAMSRIPQSANLCYFTEQAIRAGYMGPQLGRTQHEHFGHHLDQQTPHPHPQNHLFPPPHSNATHEVIQREIEMERMREEIIMSEIVRLRLRAEERRVQLMREEIIASEIVRSRAEERRVQLMMEERELALRRGSNNSLIDGSSSIMGFDSQRAPLWGTRVEDRTLGKGIVLPLPDKERLNYWRFE